MRRCASAYDAVTDVIALPCSRAAASARAQELDLPALLDGLREHDAGRRAGAWRPPCSATVARSAATAARRARGRLARRQQTLAARDRPCARSRSCRRARRAARRRGRDRRRAPRPARRRNGRSTSADPRRTPRRNRPRCATRGRASPAAHRRRSGGHSCQVLREPANAPTCRAGAGLPIVSACRWRPVSPLR